MNAMPQPRPDPREPTAPPYGADSISSSIPLSLGDATDAALAAPPPHVLWATLETAYAPSEPAPPAHDDERLAPYLALPMAVGLSLVLWVIIVELVLSR